MGNEKEVDAGAFGKVVAFFFSFPRASVGMQCRTRQRPPYYSRSHAPEVGKEPGF
jgi:hypothetical protein